VKRSGGYARRRARMLFLALALGLSALAAGLVLLAFRDNIAFFYGPTEVMAGAAPQGPLFRLGGMVQEDSVTTSADGLTVRFMVTDYKSSLPVTYTGILPDLFREGQGVVARGRLGEDGVFTAVEVLAKHDERYMPAEAVEAMKRAGTWREPAGARP